MKSAAEMWLRERATSPERDAAQAHHLHPLLDLTFLLRDDEDQQESEGDNNSRHSQRHLLTTAPISLDLLVTHGGWGEVTCLRKLAKLCSVTAELWM